MVGHFEHRRLQVEVLLRQEIGFALHLQVAREEEGGPAVREAQHETVVVVIGMRAGKGCGTRVQDLEAHAVAEVEDGADGRIRDA